jgi:ABC-type nitrate/sulfonate/bicarbonate transport system substrate-binding protein
MIKYHLPLLIGASLVLSDAAVDAQSVKTQRVMTRAVGQNLIIYEIGERLGFYRQEGLRVELILARLSTATQAVLGGSADYVNHGSAIGAILRGLPMRVLLVDSDRPPHFIVVRSGISTMKDLIGKTVGIDDFAGAAGMLVRTTIEKSGIPVEKVNMRVIGPPPFRFQALLSGLVDAAPLNFIMSKAAERQGFRILVYTGDFTLDVQLTAAAPITNILNSQTEIYRFIKASLKAQLFFFENPNDEAFKFFVELERYTDLEAAKDAWQARLMRTSENARTGVLDHKTMLETINQWTEQLKLGGAPLKSDGRFRPEDVYDFSVAKRAYDDVRREGFDPKKYHYVKK